MLLLLASVTFPLAVLLLASVAFALAVLLPLDAIVELPMSPDDDESPMSGEAELLLTADELPAAAPLLLLSAALLLLIAAPLLLLTVALLLLLTAAPLLLLLASALLLLLAAALLLLISALLLLTAAPVDDDDDSAPAVDELDSGRAGPIIIRWTTAIRSTYGD